MQPELCEGNCNYTPDPDNEYGEGVCDTCPDGKTDCPKNYVQPNGGKYGGGYGGEYGGGGGYGTKPDSGAECNTYVADKFNDCPEPRCYQDWSGSNEGAPGGCGGTEGGVCRDPVCIDLQYDEERCKSLAGCTFLAENDVCYDKSKPFPCSVIYSKDDCTGEGATAGCAWNSVMSKEDPPYDEGFCLTKGEKAPCNKFYNMDDCPASCKWVESAFSCFEKDEKLSCTTYGAEGDCPAEDGCSWQNGLCWEEGKEIPCEAFCNAFECADSGSCTFDKTNYICTKCKGGICPELAACSTYKDSLTCPEAKCEFQYAESDADDTGYGQSQGAGGTCRDKVCAGIWEASECTSHTAEHGCTWTPDKYGSGQCGVKGYSQSCLKLYDGDACTAAGCNWSGDTYACTEKNAPAGCHAYNTDECEAAEICEMSANGYECMVKSSLEPATPPPLGGKGDGTGNEDESKCTVAAYEKVKAKLEAAEQECVVVGRRQRRGGQSATVQQQECLAYFLGVSPNPTTIADACPCMWFYANEVSPWSDHWMQMSC
jgi:hypothetical protein